MGPKLDPVDIVANIATGGLYDAGKDLAQGKIGSAAENLGPWGSAVHPISPQVADIGNAVGAGAGIGGGLAGQGTGAFNPASGFGQAGAPYYAGAPAAAYGPEGIPLLSDASGNVAQNVTIDPITGQAGPGSMIPASGIAGLSGGSAAGPGGGTGNLGALAGAGAAQQVMGLLGGMAPLSMPAQGGQVAGGQMTPQQQAALLSALASEQHRGISPRFNQRTEGGQEDPGIAALRGISGGP